MTYKKPCFACHFAFSTHHNEVTCTSRAQTWRTIPDIALLSPPSQRHLRRHRYGLGFLRFLHGKTAPTNKCSTTEPPARGPRAGLSCSALATIAAARRGGVGWGGMGRGAALRSNCSVRHLFLSRPYPTLQRGSISLHSRHSQAHLQLPSALHARKGPARDSGIPTRAGHLKFSPPSSAPHLSSRSRLAP